MAPASTDPRAGRGRLSRQQILVAGLALADSGGIASLSMRKLGQEVGVEAMSLYKHVANKEDLLDGMVDLVFQELDPPPAQAAWKKAMRARAFDMRNALDRHPWAIGLMESRRTPGPASLRHHDAVIRCLLEAGFSMHMTAHAYALLDSYVYGFALQEHGLPFSTADETAAMAQGFLTQFSADEFPYLARFTNEHALAPGYHFGTEFEFGLDLILDGISRRLRTRA